MIVCEDCGEAAKRRKQCFHCGLYVCSWCWHHCHQCWPGHTRERCRNWNWIKNMTPKERKEHLDQLRRRVLAIRASGRKEFVA